MIAAVTQPLTTSRLLFSWFDIALVLVLVFGFWRGRKNGMTKEFFPASRWLTMIIAAAFAYEPLGDLLIRQGLIKEVFGKNFNEKTAAYVTAYLLVAAVVFMIFSIFKRPFKHKLEGSNLFGTTEYYFGMVAGVLRYLCMVIFALALLNAPIYSTADIQNAKAFNNRWFGGGVAGYSGDFFPTISEVQSSVFKDSLTGPFLKSNLAVLLVVSAAPGTPMKTPVIDLGH